MSVIIGYVSTQPPVPEEAAIINFADNLTTVVQAKYPLRNENSESGKVPAKKAGLTPVDAITETVSHNNEPQKENAVNVKVSRHSVISKPAVKNLEVIVDTN